MNEGIVIAMDNNGRLVNRNTAASTYGLKNINPVVEICVSGESTDELLFQFIASTKTWNAMAKEKVESAINRRRFI